MQKLKLQQQASYLRNYAILIISAFLIFLLFVIASNTDFVVGQEQETQLQQEQQQQQPNINASNLFKTKAMVLGGMEYIHIIAM